MDRYRHWGTRNADITALIKAGLTKRPVKVSEGLTEAEAYAEEMRVPSRIVLELVSASSGGMRLSDHAARSMV